MTFDRDGLRATDGAVSSSGPSEIVLSESLDATTSGGPNDYGDCGTLKRLFKKSADIRNKFKESVSDDGLHIANYDENTVVNQGTSEWPLPQLTFHHVHGSNIQILRGGRVARRRESFCKGLAFSNRPIQIDENVCIRFAEVVSNWSGVLRFGVTNVDPETFRGSELPKFACPDLTSKEGYWAKALPERYSVAGSILHFYVNAEGELYYDPSEVRFRSSRSVMGRNRASSRHLSATSVTQPQIASTSTTAHHRHLRNCSNSLSDLPASKYHGGVQFTPLTFHTVRGKHVALTHAYTVAERHAGEYACGYVFTSRPLALNEKIVIQVLDIESAYTGSMAFGLTCCDPLNLQGSALPVDSDDLLERPEYWVGIKDVAAQPKISDELSFWITEKGEVYFVKNNLTPRVIIHVDTSVKLWAYFDVYGTTQKIRVLGSVKVTTATQMIAHRLPSTALSRTSRSLLDLSPEVRTDADEQSSVLSTFTATNRHLAHDNREDFSPVLSRRTQSETGIEKELISTAAAARTSGPTFTSGEHLIGFFENLDNIHGLSDDEPNISHRPQLPPPSGPARISPVRLLPRRPPLQPSSHPPLPAQTSSHQQRSGDDEGEIGDECRICMNSKVNCVIYTCGHMSMCFECATETWHLNGECPICRKKIEDVIKIYKS